MTINGCGEGLATGLFRRLPEAGFLFFNVSSDIFSEAAGFSPLLSKTLLKARMQEESRTAIRVFRVVCVVRVPKKPQLERGLRCERGQRGRKCCVSQRFRQQRAEPGE